MTEDREDATGVLELAFKEAVLIERVEKKLEKAIREGQVKRYHNEDWIAAAEKQGILTPDEVSDYRYYNDLISQVISVDQFEPSSIRRAIQPKSEETIAAE